MSKITPLTEIEQRIKRLQKYMKTSGIAGAIILHKVNLFYFTGRVGPICFFIPVEGMPVFISRQRDDLPSGLPWPVRSFGRWADLSAVLGEFGYPGEGTLGLEVDAIPGAVYLKIGEVFPSCRLADLGSAIRIQRAVKSAWEISLLRETAEIDRVMWNMVPRFARQARTDLELAAMIEAEARRLGHVGLLRLHGFNMEMALSCVLAGEDGSVVSAYDVPISGTGLTPALPFGASGALLRPGNPIIIDFGGCYNGYITDYTRTFVLGEPRAEVLYAYESALAVQTEVIAHARPGVTGGELFERASKVAAQSGLREYFMGGAGGVPFIGHGIGLEVDELPVLAKESKQVLEVGMVIALEPKFAIPGIGAVGIENDFIITAGGIERLSDLTDDLGYISLE